MLLQKQILHRNFSTFNPRPDLFRLPQNFVKNYDPVRGAKSHPPFGFNGVGELAYLRSYSRVKDDGRQEKWFETVERVINGCFTMQLSHANDNGLKWDGNR